MKIQYKDKMLEVEEKTKISELLKKEIETSEYMIVGANYNNEYVDLDQEIKEDGKRVGWLKNVVARFNNGESLDATFTLTYEVAYKRKGWDASTPTADVMYTRLDVKPEK